MLVKRIIIVEPDKPRKKRDCHLGDKEYCPGEKNRTTNEILARCRSCRWLEKEKEER